METENSLVNILLVDDRAENLFALEVIFSNESYLCVKAKSGKEALKILRRKQEFSIILMDVQMPVMDGFEAVELIRKIEKLKHIPVIFLTASMDAPIQIFKGYQTGAVDYMVKPLSPEILRAKVAVFVDLYKKTHELVIQNEEMEKRAAELVIANKELAFQNEEKGKRAAELVIANKELAFQNEEKEKRAKELIKAKEQAEESDRLKSAFLANMSHEIRTPMNGILGFADLLREPNLTGEEQQEYIIHIEKSCARMLNIINDIVDISKIESGLMEVDFKESNINEQIEYIYKFFKTEVERKGIQLFFKNTLSAKDSIIKTDREKIFAIFTNLVKNAIKFTNEGSIEFGYILKTDNEPAELEFFVKDTGIGIPKDRQEAIFKRFIHADISNKMALQGAGLGLSITKAYVEVLGGKIWVESEEGKGSIFYFTIPYIIEPKEKIIVENAVPVNESENRVKNLKILIVEDDEISEKLITIVVKKFSKKVLKARTGIEAVEICRNNPDIDLILMDIQMPEMNGYEAIRQIRQLNKNVIIIAQTAFAQICDRKKVIEAGCNDYIPKPILKDTLLALIHKHFNKKNKIN